MTEPESMVKLENGAKDLSARIIEPHAVQRIGQPVGLLTPQIVKQVGEQVQLYRQLKLAVISATWEGDWMDFDGRPYLKDTGVQTVASSVGMVFGEPAIEEQITEDKRGKAYWYTCRLSAIWRGIIYTDIGTAGTRDPFFCKKKGQEVPIEDVDLGDVRKKAVTNAQHWILMKALGIGGVTWRDLEDQGVLRGAGGTVKLAKGDGKMAASLSALASEREELWRLLVAMTGGPSEAAIELERLTTGPERKFKPIGDPAALSQRQVEYLLPRLRRDHDRLFPGEATSVADQEQVTKQSV